jgi:hypothetical protein
MKVVYLALAFAALGMALPANNQRENGNLAIGKSDSISAVMWSIL